MLAITILGNNSAIPAFGRNPSAQLLQTQDSSFLIDCGEGTQNQLAKYKLKRSKISHIFISHLHGDHYFGLIGLLTSMSLLNRNQELHLHGPAQLEDIINLQLRVADVTLNYPLYFHALKEEGIISDNGKMIVNCFKVQHRIECWGFLFKEKKKPRSVVPELAKAYDIPAAYYEKLQDGKNYTSKKGTIIQNESVTIAAPKPKSYAYCADTLYDPSIAEKIKHVDLVYHETTYLKDLEKRAAERYHSTTIQAGMIALQAEAGQLMIGHFSSKYESLDEFLNETKTIFENTVLAIEGTCFKI